MSDAEGEYKEWISSSIYDNALNSPYYDVPLIRATAKSLSGIGVLVEDFDKEEIHIETWPKLSGTRPICKGTGNRAGVHEGDFNGDWKDGYCWVASKAEMWRYTTGRAESDGGHVRVFEANYHPDGEQCFYPKEKKPFIALLAKPTDDIKPEHFRAFYFDGTKGVKIFTGTWHQPLYPLFGESAEFRNKQGAIHACVQFLPTKEFGVFLRVPVKKESVTDSM